MLDVSQAVCFNPDAFESSVLVSVYYKRFPKFYVHAEAS